jgi:hypothetical protein
MNITMGQAIDTAIQRHRELYSESEVYAANASERGGLFRVEVLADHFSVPLVYTIRKGSN